MNREFQMALDAKALYRQWATDRQESFAKRIVKKMLTLGGCTILGQKKVDRAGETVDETWFASLAQFPVPVAIRRLSKSRTFAMVISDVMSSTKFNKMPEMDVLVDTVAEGGIGKAAFVTRYPEVNRDLVFFMDDLPVHPPEESFVLVRQSAEHYVSILELPTFICHIRDSYGWEPVSIFG